MSKEAGIRLALASYAFIFISCGWALLHADDPKIFVPKDQQTFGAGVRESERKLKLLHADLQEKYDEQSVILNTLRSENAQLHARVSELENVPGMFINGLKDLKAEYPTAQILITTSAACAPCKQLIANIIARGFKFGDTEWFRILELSEDEWRKSGLALPDVQLMIKGIKSGVIQERDPNKLYDFALAADTSYKTTQITGEQVAGLKVGTLPVKDQVQNMLITLEPFLDGGTLNLTYTPKPGVVREFLTIKRGAGGLKIPVKTSFTLAMKNGDLSIKFNDPKPQVIAGPFERGLQEIDVTPNKLSIRLPWMIDPEFGYK